jgi:FkbM family methyltransferase
VMKLSTATKIRLAGALYGVVAPLRWCLGQPHDRAICRRGGINWTLDLREGIQLSIYTFGVFERATARALRRLLPAGGVALDIGANIGAHTLPMARQAGPQGRVIAVEPTSACARLRDNLARNPELESRVTVCPVAIIAPGERLASAYYAAWPVRGAKRRHAVHGGIALNADGSAGATLDALVQEQGLSRVDLIKIDIDGGELAALRGARATLERWRPSLVLELSAYALNEQGGSLDALLALLRDARYRLLDEASFAPLPDDTATISRLIPAGGSINVVALPVERQAAVA